MPGTGETDVGTDRQTHRQAEAERIAAERKTDPHAAEDTHTLRGKRHRIEPEAQDEAQKAETGRES